MSSIRGTNVLAPVVPFDTTDQHATHYALYGKGGYRSVADIAARDAIPTLRREAGMLVLTLSDGKVWKLASDLTAWTEFSAGSSAAASVSWADVTGKPATFTPSSHTHTASQITDFSSAVAAAAPPTTDASLLTSGTLSASRFPASVVLTTDSRLSDARTPTTHSHAVADVTGLQTALDGKQASGSYAAASHTHTAGQVSGLATVATSGSYADLANKPTLFSGSYADLTSVPTSFTPSAHNQAWSTITSTPTTLSGYGITDAIGSSDSRLADSRTPTSHTHGNITNAGAIGSTSGQIVVTTTSGVLTTAATIASSAVSGLAAVATSGSYADLSNKPSIPTATTSASDLTGGTLADARLSDSARSSTALYLWANFR